VRDTSRKSRGTTGLLKWIEAAQAIGLVDWTDADGNEEGGIKFAETIRAEARGVDLASSADAPCAADQPTVEGQPWQVEVQQQSLALGGDGSELFGGSTLDLDMQMQMQMPHRSPPSRVLSLSDAISTAQSLYPDPPAEDTTIPSQQVQEQQHVLPPAAPAKESVHAPLHASVHEHLLPQQRATSDETDVFGTANATSWNPCLQDTNQALLAPTNICQPPQQILRQCNQNQQRHQATDSSHAHSNKRDYLLGRVRLACDIVKTSREIDLLFPDDGASSESPPRSRLQQQSRQSGLLSASDDSKAGTGVAASATKTLAPPSVDRPPPTVGTCSISNSHQGSQLSSMLSTEQGESLTLEDWDSEGGSWDSCWGGQRDATKDEGNLFELGVQLYELFADGLPFPGERQSSIKNSASDSVSHGSAGGGRGGNEQKKSKRSNDAGTRKGVPYTPLRDLGLPSSLCNLVSSLLNDGALMGSELAEASGTVGSVGSIPAYSSYKEVEEELHRMTLDPERYLFDSAGPSSSFEGTLCFPSDKIYGRSEQLSSLLDAYIRVESGATRTCEAVFLSGYSGTGKSAIVQSALHALIHRGRSTFMEGKFDELRQIQPLAAIASAFNGYCATLLCGDVRRLDEISRELKEAVGSDFRVLTELIPNLGRIIGEESAMRRTKSATSLASSFQSSASGISVSVPVVGGKATQIRLGYFFRRFLRAISTPSHPVILYLDDLQWADEMSLDLIEKLITDPNVSSFLFLGCYRNNEVTSYHSVTKMVQSIERQGIIVTSLLVGNMDITVVNELIADTLLLSPHQTRPLSEAVYSKTSGNALFVKAFLQSLSDEGLLYYSASSRRFEWDVNSIRSKDIADNVVELVMSKMLQLHSDTLMWLKMAACLGCQCDASIFKLLDPATGGNDALHRLSTTVDEGLMSKVGTAFRFSHDAIQHAAYALIPEDERQALHLNIGRTLWRSVPDHQLDDILFVVADQLRRGSSQICDHKEKVEVARLYLAAGKKAINSSSFLSASIYLLQGASFLDENDWKDEYDLCLDLFTSCGETNYATGNFSGVGILLQPVVRHARSLEDKIRPYTILINSLGGEGKYSDAVEMGLKVLALLGETFPENIDESHVAQDMSTTLTLLGSTTIEEILRMGELQDEQKHEANQILQLLCVHALKWNTDLGALIIFRMLRISMQYGLSKASCFAFSNISMMLCCTVGDIRRGYEYGKLALKLLERFNAREHLPRVYVTVYGLVYPYTEPCQACLPSHQHAYKVAMELGDIEWAVQNVNLYTLVAMQCGSKLGPLIQELKNYLQELKDFNHLIITTIIPPTLQYFKNLVDPEGNPTVLCRDGFDMESFLQQAEENSFANLHRHCYFMCFLLAYLFDDMERAREMYHRYDKAEKSFPLTNPLPDEVFASGLLATATVRSSEDNALFWRRIAHDSHSNVCRRCENSSWNNQHRMHLLTAEIAYMNGDAEAAAVSYGLAITSAGEHKFLHEKALAYERAGIFYADAGHDFEEARKHFELAHSSYLEWGATRKASDLASKFLSPCSQNL